MIVELLPEADEEFAEIIGYYEDQRVGLGTVFSRSVREAITDIFRTPKAYPAMTKRVRKKSGPGFPYRVIYQPQTDIIRIVAVAHTARRPGYWRSRLGD